MHYKTVDTIDGWNINLLQGRYFVGRFASPRQNTYIYLHHDGSEHLMCGDDGWFDNLDQVYKTLDKKRMQ